MQRAPAPVVPPSPATVLGGLDPGVRRAWAVRLRAAGDEVDAVASALRSAGQDVIGRGPAGLALSRLVDSLAGDVRTLAVDCRDLAGRLVRPSTQ